MGNLYSMTRSRRFRRDAQLKSLVAVAIWVSVLAPTWAQLPDVVSREADLIDTTGATIGGVTVRGSAHATVIRIRIMPGGLAPGWHGLQLHAKGDCSDVSGFARAKGPIDHIIKSHGLLHPDGPREGNLPNIYVNADGSAQAEVSSHAVRLLGQTGLIEGDGSALIIHAGEDDQMSQPVGNAGARVACAVLK